MIIISFEKNGKCYQKCVLKLSTVFAVSRNSSPSIRPHPITPNPYRKSSLAYEVTVKTMRVHNLNKIPALIIGSIVKVCPAFITPTALFPASVKVRNDKRGKKDRHNYTHLSSYLNEDTSIMGNIRCTMKEFPNTMTTI